MQALRGTSREECCAASERLETDINNILFLKNASNNCENSKVVTGSDESFSFTWNCSSPDLTRTRVSLLFFTAKFFYCHHLYGRIRFGFVGQVCVHIQGLWLQFSVMLS